MVFETARLILLYQIWISLLSQCSSISALASFLLSADVLIPPLVSVDD